MGTIISDAEAKAAQEAGRAVTATAQMGTRAIEVVAATGPYIERTIGALAEEVIGAVTDFVRHQRERTWARMMAKTRLIIEHAGASQLEEPSVSVLRPLLEGAVDEARPELQELWAGLLASAMLPGGGNRVRRAFFDTLRQMEPDDALLFDRVAAFEHEWRNATQPAGMSDIEWRDRKESAYQLARAVQGKSADAIEVAASSLEQLGLAKRNSYNARLIVTPYGKLFRKACSPEEMGRLLAE